MPPIQTSGTGGVVLVSWVADSEGVAAGVERGDRVLAVDGAPIREWFRARGWEGCAATCRCVYRVEKPAARGARWRSCRCARRSFYEQFLVPTFAAVSRSASPTSRSAGSSGG